MNQCDIGSTSRQGDKELMTALIVLIMLLFTGFLFYVFFSGPRLPPETDAIIERVLNSDLPELIAGRTGFASSGGLKIWYECISPEGLPKGTVLLITALGGHALEWSPKIMGQFLDAGYQIVRYDQRGTGLSDWMEAWDPKNPYSIADMARDAIAVLDALGFPKVHIIGLSMGGMIAQEIAIQNPTRVISLTLLMSSGYIGDPELPGISSRYLIDYIVKGVPLLKYRMLGGEKNIIKERIAKQVSLMGYERLEIEETARALLYDLRKRRGINVRAIFQHQAAVWISGSRYKKLRALDVPTLITHGKEDQFVPFEHGKKLAEVMPNAKGLWLDGVGHVFPVPEMEALMRSIISHLDDHPAPGAYRAGDPR
jgi:pimeloyl-ACP methyl ester carboxylesterase